MLINATIGKNVSTQKQIATAFAIAEGLAMTNVGENVQYHPPLNNTPSLRGVHQAKKQVQNPTDAAISLKRIGVFNNAHLGNNLVLNRDLQDL